MSNPIDDADTAERARQQQDEIAAETGFDDPHFDDDGRNLHKPKRTYPAGSKRPGRAKPGAVQVTMRLAADCHDYCAFLVENGNAANMTQAIELCIRGDRAAQRVPGK